MLLFLHPIGLITEWRHEGGGRGEHEQKTHLRVFNPLLVRRAGGYGEHERRRRVVADNVTQNNGGDVHSDEDTRFSGTDGVAAVDERRRNRRRHSALLHRRGNTKRRRNRDYDFPFHSGASGLLSETSSRHHDARRQESGDKEIESSRDKDGNHNHRGTYRRDEFVKLRRSRVFNL